ncbi:hypothetical protein EPA93_38280 [Ktedonosporobacter rubrisoli]|uniref:DUF2029 domain-containing protein n=1 Tax=Ktedonosporobacter rubrisoli TaxID=2509675 RepID=A0A4P6K010_KTERU|nr:hypothetical protein [Ktedonosporobacter rubrisoli]QBD81508.1 hypothetical protein EPA93_38280 [Ktedonosporobacter rubrisoli]
MTTYQQVNLEPAGAIPSKQRYLFPLLIVGIFELLYLLMVALSPFPGLHLSDTPLVKAWPWTLLPSHVLAGILQPFMQASLRHELFSPMLLGLTFIGLTATYLWAIIAALRMQRSGAGAKADYRWLVFLLASVLLFGLTLLFQPLLLSDDVFTHIFSGRLLVIYGVDPLNTAPRQFPHDPYLQWVLSGRDAPNIFGPLWLCIAALLASISNYPPTSLLLFKGTILLIDLVNCLLIWKILAQMAPERKLLGTLLYAWNPLVLIELVGNGHNEGVLICILLITTWFYMQNQIIWKICAFITLGLAISTNLVGLLLAPFYLWFDVRKEHNIGQLFWKLSWRTTLVLIPALLVFFPFWRGASTFFAVTSAIDMEHFVHSPVSILADPMHSLFQSAANLLHFPALVPPSVAADITLRASATFIFVLLYMHLLSQVRHASRRGRSASDQQGIWELDILLSSCSIAVFWYMLLVSGWFWPWYLLWMLWIVMLRRFDTFTSAMLLLSCTALFIYPFVGFTRGPIAKYQTALIFGLPLIYLIVANMKQKHIERIAHVYEQRSHTAQD